MRVCGDGFLGVLTKGLRNHVLTLTRGSENHLWDQNLAIKGLKNVFWSQLLP